MNTKQPTMALNEESAHDQIIERDGQLQIRQKWGDRIVGRGGGTGFVALPEALIRGQNRLKISSTEMMVLINAISFWWYVDNPPFPSNHKIAKRMGVSTRTVQRAFESLERKKLVHRDIKKYTEDDKSYEYDTPYESRRYLHFNGLIERLGIISDDLRNFNSR